AGAAANRRTALFAGDMGAQGGVDPRLPPGPAAAKMVDDILVKAQRHLLLPRIERRPATADNSIAVSDFSALELLAGQLRDVLVLLRLNLMRVELSQVGIDNALALGH